MIIFIRNIPENLPREDLERHITGGLRRVRMFPSFAKGRLDEIDILRISHQNGIEYHGLALIEGERAAKALIKYLQGSSLGGNTIRLRQYRQRAENRDRRSLHIHSLELAIIDRRQRDRRRKKLRIETLYGTGLAADPPGLSRN